MSSNIHSKKTKILFCGESLNGISGLAYTISNIMLRFIKALDRKTGDFKYDVAYATICGSDTDRSRFSVHGSEFEKYMKDIPVFNCQVAEKEGASKFNEAVKVFSPDIVFSNHDPWFLDSIAMSLMRESYYWVNYTTIETPYYPDNVMLPTSAIPVVRKSMKEVLNRANLLIPVTSIGTKVLKDMGLKNVSENHVYNGLDFSLKNDGLNISKNHIFGPQIANDDFVFMTLGTNSERKKLDVVIEAFAKFIKKMNYNKKYKLYLHTNLDERIGGTDLITQINVLGLKEHVFAPISFRENKLMQKRDLYKRYQASDCYVGLPAGEGFGYGYAEALMHKKPVIYLDYGGPSDYLKDIGLPVKVKETFAARNVYMKWALADTDDACKQMCRIVSDEKLRNSLGEKGYKKAWEFEWNNIFKQIETILIDNYSKAEKSELFEFNLTKLV